jgi:septal ring factor EnvC (AmiA/AmiB activator)
MLAKIRRALHSGLSMKNSIGIVILTLACVGLAIALVVSQSNAAKERKVAADQISTHSNNWVQTSEKLDEQRKVNITLTNDLAARLQDLSALTNQLTETSNTLAKTEDSLKTAQDEVTKRDSQIADLESQNKQLDAKAADLSASITNLQSQIDDTQKKLAASEGDKAFLEKELQRLVSEKAELERQFNDLKVLKAQVAKLKEELSISRRLAWIREGVFARAEQKGGEQLMQKTTPAFGANTNPPPKQANYDLNVEVNADGTVRVIPPMTNSAPTTPPPQ